MQTKLAYPAIVTVCKKEERYTVKFIDFECSVVGKTMADAILLAQEEMGKYLSKLSELPDVFSRSVKLNLNEDVYEDVIYIAVDMLNYYKRNSKKIINKTVTLPEWLNELAEESGINFSKILREGLKKELGIEE